MNYTIMCLHVFWCHSILIILIYVQSRVYKLLVQYQHVNENAQNLTVHVCICLNLIKNNAVHRSLTFIIVNTSDVHYYFVITDVVV